MHFNSPSLNQMYVEIKGFVVDLTSALRTKSGITHSYKHIVICGMGASAIGGALYVDSMYYCSEISVEVLKTMDLPTWVDNDTLFVACSFSGNTYETIKLYEQAVEAGLDVLVITHGGRLLEKCIQNGNYLMMIESKQIQPRSAIGWFIGLLGGVIEDSGGPKVRD